MHYPEGPFSPQSLILCCHLLFQLLCQEAVKLGGPENLVTVPSALEREALGNLHTPEHWYLLSMPTWRLKALGLHF